MVARGLARAGRGVVRREVVGDRWRGVSGLRLRLQRGHDAREAVRIPDKLVGVDRLTGGQFRLQELAVDRQRSGRASEGLVRLARIVAEIAAETLIEIAKPPRRGAPAVHALDMQPRSVLDRATSLGRLADMRHARTMPPGRYPCKRC